jgi:putative ABC transport system ATP-binding protein
MAQAILKLNNLTKTYILGTRKNARKAQKAIQKLHEKYEKQVAKKRVAEAARTWAVLDRAQVLFAREQYEDSFKTITGKNLKKRPRDRGEVVHALNNISLEIKEGELLAVMGPSGSGKSTLLNMLGLLDDPTAGEVYLKGQSVASIKKRNLPDIRAHQLGFVFQTSNLVPTLTALENVMLPLKYSGVSLRKRRQVAREALERVGLGDRLNHNPNELSGGQRQRVAIARSIVNKPAMVFGDELTGELDTKMTADVMKLVLELNKKGQTFIIVTHNPEVAKLCQRIILMRDGKIEKELKRKRV